MTAEWPLARDSHRSAALPPGAVPRALLKARPEDFQVCELPAFEPEGAGEHLFLRLEKTGLSTRDTAQWLARCYQVPEVAVGYAGLKDTRAVTEQWFSVHTPAGPERLEPRSGVRLLDSSRHRGKLRRGDLAGNHFRIRLAVPGGDDRSPGGDDWAPGLTALGERGAPNYFGPQRFGRDNLAQAMAWLPERRRRRISRFRSGLYLSVLRSYLFNEVLASRVRAGTWQTVLPGEATLAGPSGQPLPSGPLWGRGRSPATDQAGAVETEALTAHAEICAGLEHAGLKQDRRALVLVPGAFGWEAEAGSVTVTFTLPPGGYATTLLAEAFDLSLPREAA